MFNSILDDMRAEGKADINDLCLTTIFALEAHMKAVVETQTIMHLLIKKGIVTEEEISEMRAVVEHSSPTVIDLQADINELSETYESREKMKANADKFAALFKKSLKDPSSLTPEERAYVDKELKATTEALKQHLSEES